ncbi:MAG: HEPN domain-containing protein [Thermoproteus sp. AZ2]|uniref:HEPN domain-containing protein n=1 Tax=Thermoproteus sp. AZ2 TaxID=1609232 RepID=A0ACC6V1G3_9CREN|nr:MAG: DNA-binding protein [Thermoproteus sp. AZ2]
MYVHPKWYERHVRHLNDAITAMELGDDKMACYNAYVSVEALARGILGHNPYGDYHKVERLPALIKAVAGAEPPEEVQDCAKCLERSAFSESGERCIKCAEVISNYLYIFLKAKSHAADAFKPF